MKSYYLSFFLLLSFVLHSCSVQKVFPAVKVDPSQEKIARHIADGDMSKLVGDINDYPNYAEQVRNYILNIDYSLNSYPELKSLCDVFASDSVLADFFDSHVRAYENRTFSYVKNLDLKGVIEYFSSHFDEQAFLQPVLCEKLPGEIQGMEYKELRAARSLLMGTVFDGLADSLYLVKRKSLEKSVKKSLDLQSKREAKIIADMTKYVQDTLDVYVSTAFAGIIRSLASKKNLPEKKSDVDGLVRHVQDEFFNPERMNMLSCILMERCIDAINESRYEYYSQLVGAELPETSRISIKSRPVSTPSVKKANASSLYRLSEQQNKTDGLGAVITIAGFIPGLGLAATAASAVNSYSKGKKTAEVAAECFKDFAKSYMPILQQTKNQIVANYKKIVQDELKKSHKSFENAVYENY